MKLHINKNADRLDFDPTSENGEEYLRATLLPVCGQWNYEEFKEWIDESNWEVFESSNHSWINTKTLRVISTETLYQLYAVDNGYVIQSKCGLLRIQSIL